MSSHYNMPKRGERRRSHSGALAGIGFAALIGLVVVYAAMHNAGEKVTSPYDKGGGVTQKAPPPPPVRNPS